MPSPRVVVADKIRGVVPDGITVYHAGQDVIATPAIVVWPDDPYEVPTNLGDDTVIAAYFSIYVISNRGSVTDAMDQLEELRRYVTDGIRDTSAVPVGRWSSFGRFGTVDVGGQPYAAAVVDTVFRIMDTE